MAQSRDGESPAVAARVEIGAPPARVWQALSEERELMRWFALDARVRPGPGGSIRVSWGSPMVADWLIDEWQPAAYLRLSERRPIGGGNPQPSDDGDALPAEAEPPRTLTFVLTGDQTGTAVSLVHAGFGRDADPDFLQVIRRGWEYELHSLRHYLERHAGRRRDVVWICTSARGSIATLWARLMQALEISVTDGPGQRSFAMRAPDGEALTGTCDIFDPPHQLVATLETARDALFRLKIAPQPGGSIEINIWLATWRLRRTVRKQLERAWQDRVGRVLASDRAIERVRSGKEETDIIAAGVGAHHVFETAPDAALGRRGEHQRGE